MPRGFGPTRINSWVNNAELLSQKSETADLGFLIAFTAWEALQCRVLAVALRQQGYSLAVAHEYLGSSVHNDRKPIKSLFEFVFLKNPANVTGLGTGWRELERRRQSRNRFAHGLGTLSPAELRERTFDIVNRLRDTSWLEATPLPSVLGNAKSDWTRLGPVMGALRPTRSNGHGPEHIGQRIRVLRKALN